MAVAPAAVWRCVGAAAADAAALTFGGGEEGAALLIAAAEGTAATCQAQGDSAARRDAVKELQGLFPCPKTAKPLKRERAQALLQLLCDSRTQQAAAAAAAAPKRTVLWSPSEEDLRLLAEARRAMARAGGDSGSLGAGGGSHPWRVLEHPAPGRPMSKAADLLGLQLRGLRPARQAASGGCPGRSPAALQPVGEGLGHRLVFLLIGQSNMAGRAPSGSADAPHPRAFALSDRGKWRTAAEPVNPHDGRSQGMGPGLSFARALLDRLPAHSGVFLVPAAVGATCLHEWSEGGPLYEAAVARATLGAEACGGRLAGVLWHQGEGDAPVESAARSYGARLAQLVRSMRDSLRLPGLPFLAGHLGDFLDNCTQMPQRFQPRHWRQVNRAISELAAAGVPPAVAEVPADRLTGKADNLHFDAQGQRELGRRYAETWWRLFGADFVPGAELPPAAGAAGPSSRYLPY
eukprot:TRINITY_DN18627_c0_g1_i1.p1 TRINITY_DN18627_c0_g1~~TRINITY_DN18627_c0_g1_i1.p1  ORF type:complete len:494 (+),score=94.42 TRINITY_DN18627_c0_g1_i1:97-1482(+)